SGPDLFDESDARVTPGVLLYFHTCIENVQGTMQIVDVLGVPAGLPCDVFLLALFRCAKSVVSLQWRGQILLHDRPIEKQVVVESVNVSELRQEAPTGGIAFGGDLSGVRWMVVRNCTDKHFPEACRVLTQPAG